MSGVSSVFPSIVPLLTGSLKAKDPSHFYSMGIDLAKSVDYTAVSIIDRNTHELVYQSRWQTDWNQTMETLVGLFKAWNRPTVTIDSTGVGDPISEMLKRRGVRMTESSDFKFSGKSKDQLVKKMCLFFSEKKIILPNSDEIQNLVNEIEQYSYEILPSGKIRYSAPPGKHDDEVMSLGLAMWPLKDQKETQLYTTGTPNQTVANLDPF
jgi:phage FluMu gp28-like protein